MSFDLFDSEFSLPADRDFSWMDECDYRLVTTRKDLDAMLMELSDASFLTYDVETTGLNLVDDTIVGFQFAGRPKQGFYIPVAHQGVSGLSFGEAIAACEPLFSSGLVGHNIGFDWAMTSPFIDFPIRGDTLIEWRLHDVYKPYGLDDLAKAIFKLDQLKFDDLFPKRTPANAKRFDVVPIQLAVPYACSDVDFTWRLFDWLGKRIDRKSTIWKLEHELIKVVTKMELFGMGFRQQGVIDAAQIAEGQIADDIKIVDELAGWHVEMNSVRDLQKLLFDQCGLPVLQRTPKGAPATGAEVLERLKGLHDVVDPILRFRQVSRLKSGFLDKLPSHVASDGRIHTQYNQVGAKSGRFTSRHPNLQQIPKERGKAGDDLRAAIRSAFYPGDDYAGILDIDYSQIEYRVFACLSQDRALMRAFWKDVDFHTNTASIMFGVDLDKVDKHLRQRGKTLNFGSIFGMSAHGLARQLKCSEAEAELLLEKYWSVIPDAERWVARQRKETSKTGECRTYFGRCRKFPYVFSKDKSLKASALRECINTPVQGTAADILKFGMVRCARKLTSYKTRMALTVHDELAFCHHPDDDLDEVSEVIRESMELKLPNWVPLKTDPAYGPDWNSTSSFTYPSRREVTKTSVVIDGSRDVSEELGIGKDVSSVEEQPEGEEQWLLIKVAQGDNREDLSAARSLFSISPGEIPVKLNVMGKVLLSEYKVCLTRDFLLELKQLGIAYSLSEATKRDLRKQILQKDLLKK